MKNVNNGTRGRGAHAKTLLRDDLAAIREDLGSLVRGRIDAAGQGATKAAQRARATGQELVAEGRTRALAMHRRLGDTAGAHPIKTIVAAAVVGVIGTRVLAWMWRR